MKQQKMTMKILRISESSNEFSIPKNVPTYTSRSVTCNCFNMFHSIFSRTFYRVGYVVGTYPSYFIIIPFFLSVLGLTGFQNIRFERDSDYLFNPSDGDSKITRDVLEDLFPNNSSQLFDVSRISRATNFAKIYISAKDGDTMFRTKIWNEVVLLDDLIQNITVEWNGNGYKYKDMCARWHGECYPNNIYNLNDIIPEVENRTTWISYPIMLFPFVLPMFFGGADINEEEGVMLSAKALLTTYWLRQDEPDQKERAHIWEGKLLDLLAETDFDYIHVDRFVSRSVPDEMAKVNEELRNYLPFALLLLVGFSIFSLISFDWVRSKIQMGILGVFTVILAICSSFGFLMYVGIPFIGINTAAPFLILGIGLDDMFVILCAWRKTKIQDRVPNRIAATYGSTAVSITITSLTNMAAFFIGTFTSFPGVRIFCIYLGVSVIFTYMWFISFFGACLALIGNLEKQQRHSLLCWKIKSKSENDKSSWCSRIMCSGGINKKDPWNALDNKPGRMSSFFKNYFAPSINFKPVKGCIIVLYIAYITGAIYGCLQIKEGLDPKNVALDDSYLTDFFDIENKYFRKFPYRIQVIIKGNLSYSSKETKKNIMELHRSLENLTYVGPRLYTRSWIRSFLGYLGRRPLLRNNVTDEVSFIDVLKDKFIEPLMKESLDVVYNEDKSRILASRFIIQGYEIKDMEEDRAMIQALRKVAEDSPLDVSVYHPAFLYFDQNIMVTSTTLKSIALAALSMMVVSFLFIPNPLSSIWVAISILSIEVGVIGFMSLWGVRLDSISMVNLIMSIGFSVDFSAHIVYSFVTSKFIDPDDRVKESLYSMGLPIVQCSMSTILGVLLFILVPSYIYRTFFKVIFLVTILGTLHALFVLPTMLSLTYKVFCRGQETSNPKDRPSTNNCPQEVIKGEGGIGCEISKRDSCYESSSLSRLSSLSVQTESLRSSQSSSEPSSESDATAPKQKEPDQNQESIQVEHL